MLYHIMGFFFSVQKHFSFMWLYWSSIGNVSFVIEVLFKTLQFQDFRWYCKFVNSFWIDFSTGWGTLNWFFFPYSEILFSGVIIVEETIFYPPCVLLSLLKCLLHLYICVSTDLSHTAFVLGFIIDCLLVNNTEILAKNIIKIWLEKSLTVLRK